METTGNACAGNAQAAGDKPAVFCEAFAEYLCGTVRSTMLRCHRCRAPMERRTGDRLCKECYLEVA